MDEQHEHPHPQQRRFTIWMRGFLGIPFCHVFVGIGSEHRNGEFLIYQENSMEAVNHANVLWMKLEDIVQAEHSHA